MPSATRVGKSRVTQIARRQFQWPGMVDRTLDDVITQKRIDVAAKAATPLALGSFAIAGGGTLDHAEIEARIE